jgi:lipoprotein-releasing system permease protein
MVRSLFLEWWISKRYLRPKGKERFFSIITVLSFFGISSGVTILIVVMSVMNGLRSELFDKIVGLNGHILIHPSSEKGIDNSSEIYELLSEIEEVTNIIPMLESQVLAMGESQSSGALLRGLSPKSLNSLNIISSNIISGDINNIQSGEAVIGSRLASSLRLYPGDNITLLSPRGISSPFGTIPRSLSFDVKGVFEIGMTDYDGSVVFLNIEDARKFLNLGEVYGVIEVMLSDADKSLVVKDEIDLKLKKYNVYSRDWRETNASLAEAMMVEKNVMLLVLSLILIIAGINIASGLVMLIKDKGREISILRAMGMSKLKASRVFIISGLKIGFSATFWGVLAGVLISPYVEEIRLTLSYIFQVTFFNPEFYFLSQLPSELKISDVTLVSLMSILMSLLSTIYPSYRAIARDPVEALRNE